MDRTCGQEGAIYSYGLVLQHRKSLMHDMEQRKLCFAENQSISFIILAFVVINPPDTNPQAIGDDANCHRRTILHHLPISLDR